MTDEDIAQEIIKRVIAYYRLHCKPLRLLDPEDKGERLFKIGSYHFQLRFWKPQFWSLVGPKAGELKRIAAQKGIGFSHYNTAGYPFFLNTENAGEMIKQHGAIWALKRDECLQELLPCLRHNMVLDDLADIAAL